MAKIDILYHDLLKKVLDESYEYEDPNRKGISRFEIPHHTLTYDFKHGFPALTTKKLFWKLVVSELLWFLSGDDTLKYLHDNNNHIWDKDAKNYYNKLNDTDVSLEEFLEIVKKDPSKGELGRIYGKQWTNWNGRSDQIQELSLNMIRNPMSTKHIVTAWNPDELENMALPPCHWSFEILTQPIVKKGANPYKHGFYLKWHQRSVDVFLGLPFNIASYALLAHIIGKLTNMKPLGIIGDLSNIHIYDEHLSSVVQQLRNDPNKYESCELNFKISKNVKDYQLINYKSYDAIKAKMLEYNK